MSPRQTPLIVAIAIGAAGGTARYINDVQHHGRRFAVAAFASALVTAAFFGWLVAEVAQASGHEGWGYAAAGIGGFMGTQTLDLALDFVRRTRLGSTTEGE